MSRHFGSEKALYDLDRRGHIQVYLNGTVSVAHHLNKRVNTEIILFSST